VGSRTPVAQEVGQLRHDLGLGCGERVRAVLVVGITGRECELLAQGVGERHGLEERESGRTLGLLTVDVAGDRVKTQVACCADGHFADACLDATRYADKPEEGLCVLVDLAVTVVVRPVAGLDRRLSAKSASVLREVFVDDGVAVVVQTVAHLIHRLERQGAAGRPTFLADVEAVLHALANAVVARLAEDLKVLVKVSVTVVVQQIAGLNTPVRRLAIALQAVVRDAITVIVKVVADLATRLIRHCVALQLTIPAFGVNTGSAALTESGLAHLTEAESFIDAGVTVVIQPVAGLDVWKLLTLACVPLHIRARLFSCPAGASTQRTRRAGVARTRLTVGAWIAVRRVLVYLAIAVVVHPVADLDAGHDLIATSTPASALTALSSACAHAFSYGLEWTIVAAVSEERLIHLSVAVVVCAVTGLSRNTAAVATGVGHAFVDELVAVVVFSIACFHATVALDANALEAFVNAFVTIIVKVVTLLLARLTGSSTADRVRSVREADKLPDLLAGSHACAAVVSEGESLVGFTVAVVVARVADLVRRCDDTGLAHDIAVSTACGAAFRNALALPGLARLTKVKVLVHAAVAVVVKVVALLRASVSGLRTADQLAVQTLTPPDCDALANALFADSSDSHDVVDRAVAVVVHAITDLATREYLVTRARAPCGTIGARLRSAAAGPHVQSILRTVVAVTHLARGALAVDPLIRASVAVVVHVVTDLGQGSDFALTRAEGVRLARADATAACADIEGLIRTGVAGLGNRLVLIVLVNVAVAVVVQSVADLDRSLNLLQAHDLTTLAVPSTSGADAAQLGVARLSDAQLVRRSLVGLAIAVVVLAIAALVRGLDVRDAHDFTVRASRHPGDADAEKHGVTRVLGEVLVDDAVAVVVVPVASIDLVARAVAAVSSRAAVGQTAVTVIRDIVRRIRVRVVRAADRFARTAVRLEQADAGEASFARPAVVGRAALVSRICDTARQCCDEQHQKRSSHYILPPFFYCKGPAALLTCA
jgi:hypothetical protein